MKHDIELRNGNKLTIEIDRRKTDAIHVQEWNPAEKGSFFSRFEADGSFIEGSDQLSGLHANELTDEAVAEIERIIGHPITWE